MTKHQTALSLLPHILAHVPFDGWSEAALKAGARDAGVPEAEVVRYFPHGGIDALNLFVAEADRRMVNDFIAKHPDPKALKVRERIATLIRIRLEAYEEHKEAIRRGAALYALPIYAGEGVKSLANTVDAIWIAAGDNATDYNWYTKRFLLSGVYTSTLLYWLNDNSDGHSDTWQFLARRIDNVMQIPKWKAFILRRA